MDITSILETIIGSFFGAFGAYFSGIGVYKFNLNRNRKQELKRYFGLLDSNHKAIDELGRIFNNGLNQNDLKSVILMVKKSNDPNYKLHNIKKQGVKLTLEIKDFCKDDVLRRDILQQIDFQDSVYEMLCSLKVMADDELEEKINKPNSEMKAIIDEMRKNIRQFCSIQSELKKLKLL